MSHQHHLESLLQSLEDSRRLGYKYMGISWDEFSHHEVRTGLEERFRRDKICGRQELEEVPIFCIDDADHILRHEPCGWAKLTLDDLPSLGRSLGSKALNWGG